MFSIKEKQLISQVIESTIRALAHPEMDNNNIRFTLHVEGRESWSFADIHENAKVAPANQNPWNEVARSIMESKSPEEKSGE